MKKNIMLACLMAMALGAQAQQGGITQDMLNQIKSSYKHTPADKAIYNAMAETSIAVLAKNHENLANFDTNFTNKVVSHGITDQAAVWTLLAFYRIERIACSNDG